MPPRSYDRFMVDVRNGTSFKLAALSHAHYRAFFSAVVPIAAMSQMRGAFMVDDEPATAEHMRVASPKLTLAECATALDVFRKAGLLDRDEDGIEWVHHFEEWNPEPKKDSTNAERQQRYRAKQRALRNASNAVTGRDGNGEVTPPEVEVEVEGKKANAFSSALADQERPEVARLCRLLGDLMLANDPGAKTAPDSKSWRNAGRLLIDADGRPVEQVEEVIRWSQADPFWRANILSMPKLRTKFGALLLKMQSNGGGNSHGPAANEFALLARQEAA